MAEANQYIFEYKEIAEALVKKQGIHEGLWGLYFEFNMAAANINSDETSKVLTPAAIVAVRKIGLQRFPEETNLTVNAAEVNPAPESDKEGAGDKAEKQKVKT